LQVHTKAYNTLLGGCHASTSSHSPALFQLKVEESKHTDPQVIDKRFTTSPPGGASGDNAIPCVFTGKLFSLAKNSVIKTAAVYS